MLVDLIEFGPKPRGPRYVRLYDVQRQLQREQWFYNDLVKMGGKTKRPPPDLFFAIDVVKRLKPSLEDEWRMSKFYSLMIAPSPFTQMLMVNT